MRNHTRSRKAQYIDRKERQLKSSQERARAKRLSRMATALEVRADPDNNNLSTRERMKTGKQPQLRMQTLTLLPPLLLVIRETQEEEVTSSNKDSRDTRADLEERKEKRRKSQSSLHPIMSTLLATGGDQRRPRSM